MPILVAVLGHEKFVQMMKSGYEITVLPNFASFLVKFKQAHKAKVEWFLNILEGQQTKEGIQYMYMATNADVKEAKHQYTNERNKDHKAKVEQIMKIIDDQLTEEDIHCLSETSFSLLD